MSYHSNGLAYKNKNSFNSSSNNSRATLGETNSASSNRNSKSSCDDSLSNPDHHSCSP